LIPVALAPEPLTFETEVRRPGSQFLKKHPKPSNNDFKQAPYWRECLGDMHKAYGGICAYSARWLSHGTVDHFHPKSVRPDLAYEWTNYRYASERMNSYKGDSTAVADPCSILPGWFALDFSTFFAVPGDNLPQKVTVLVSETIRVLRLNKDNTLVEERFLAVEDYARGDVTLEYLDRRYPFIAHELRRQNLTEGIKSRFQGLGRN